MAKHPTIKVTLRAPEQGYEEILQRNLRDVVTNTLPDVAFHGLNRQRTLDERDIPVDLKPFMDADPRDQGARLLAVAAVARSGRRQADRHRLLALDADPLLQRRPGESRRRRPGQAAVELGRGAEARRRHRTIRPRTSTGMFFDWTITGNWSWQGLVLSHGGTMLNPTETKVAFTDEPGVRVDAPAAAHGR